MMNGILDLDLSSPEFADLVDVLKQTVDVMRSGQSSDDPMVEIALGIEMVILPTERPVDIRFTGEVNEHPQFDAWLLIPNPNINAGDVVQRAGSEPRLFVTYAPPAVGRIQKMNLEQERS